MRNIIFHIYLILFFIFVFQIKSYSQNWINYSVANGLSDNRIAAIVEDNHGKIWVGTYGGLNQFNGRDWFAYNRAIGDSLISDFITTIMKDSEGDLWIGTRQGLSKIDPEDDLQDPMKWNNYNHTNTKGGLVDNHITSLLEDNDGNIWIATAKKGISIVKPVPLLNQDPLLVSDNWTIVNTNSQLLSLEIFALEIDNLGNIWIGTFDGVSRYNPKLHSFTGKWDLFPELGDVRSIFADNHGYVWFGRAGKGVTRVLAIDPTKRNEFIFAGDADAIGEDSDGKIWLGTADRVDGIYVVDPKSNLDDFNNWFQFTQQDGLADNVISHIFRDSERDMWVGTGERGISKYDISWLNFSKGFDLDFSNVIAVAEDDSNNLWFGTDDRGLHIVNLYTNLFLKKNWTTIQKMEKALASDFIRTIFKDDTGHFWIGTYIQDPGLDPKDPKYGGLNLVNPIRDLSNTDNWLRFTVANTDSGLTDNNVNVITQDRARYMWFGTNHGLSRVHRDSILEKSRWANFSTANGLNSNEIHSILIDKQNFLWLGTAKGLNRIKLAGNLRTGWENLKVFNGKQIETLFEDLEGNIWCGTKGTGVYKINPMMDPHNSLSWNLIASNDGLNSTTTVHAIAQKRLQEYWFATTSGLFRLRVNSGDSLWTVFTAEDGPAALGILSSYIDTKGDLWFGTVGKGVTRHRIKSTPPETFITSKLDVTSADNVVMKFKGADLNTSTQMFRYSFQFDNKGWSPFLQSEVIPIFGLSSGRHLFDVRAVDMDGNIDPTPARDVFYKINPRLGGKVETSDSLARVRLYFPPGELEEGREVTISSIKNYEFADSLIIVAYDIALQQGTLQLKKPATLAISFLNTLGHNSNRIAIFRQEQGTKSAWIGLGGTVTAVSDTLTIMTAITEFGRYAVRKERTQAVATQINDEINIQPRIFSPTGSGQGHGDRAIISFLLKNDSIVNVKIYDLDGRLKKILKENFLLLAGINAVDWNGRDDEERICASGLYIVAVEVEGKVRTKTVVISNKYQ